MAGRPPAGLRVPAPGGAAAATASADRNPFVLPTDAEAARAREEKKRATEQVRRGARAARRGRPAAR